MLFIITRQGYIKEFFVKVTDPLIKFETLKEKLTLENRQYLLFHSLNGKFCLLEINDQY